MNIINRLRQALQTEQERENRHGMFVEVLEALVIDGDVLTTEIDKYYDGKDDTLRSYINTTLYNTSRDL